MSTTHEQLKQRRLKIAKFCKSNTASAAAAKFGMSKSLVSKACREHDVRPRMSEDNWAHVSTFEILKRMIDGESGSAIARDCHVSRQSVFCVKKRAIKAGFDL